jgi:membrane-bound ClpP family serine protease
VNDLSQMEHGALRAFLATPGALKSGLEKFVSSLAEQHRRSCTMAMASVPRQIEVASDNAAKAQVLDEFWDTLADLLVQPEPEPEAEEVL